MKTLDILKLAAGWLILLPILILLTILGIIVSIPLYLIKGTIALLTNDINNYKNDMLFRWKALKFSFKHFKHNKQLTIVKDYVAAWYDEHNNLQKDSISNITIV